MKKIIRIIFVVLLMLTPSLTFGANIFVGIDNTMPLADITGIQFDVVGVSSINDFSLNTFVSTDSLKLGNNEHNGGSNAIWDFFKVKKPTFGVSGYDQTFGSFHLSPGIILGIQTDLDITLTNWIVMVGSGETYQGHFTVLQDVFTDVSINNTPLEGGATLYTISAVPIPTTAVLFLSGIFGLVGIRKFKAGGLEG